MKYKFFLLFLFASLNGEFEAINAFPNLSFEDPVGIYHAGDGSNRIFILEQPGVIKVFENNPNTTIANTFLDISSIVLSL